MTTRIISFLIAIAFLFSAFGVFAYFVWRYASEEKLEPQTTEEIDAERLANLNNYGQLTNFEPLTESLNALEVEEVKSSDAESFVIETDIVTFKYWYALAQSGQIFYSHSAIGEHPRTAGMSSFLEGFRDLLLDKKVGSSWRILVPYKDIEKYIDLGEVGVEELPTGSDIVLDIEIVGIADRALKGFADQEALSDFEPLQEALTELRIENLREGTGTAVAKNDTLVVNYIGVTAGDGEIFDQNDATSFGLVDGGLIEGWVVGLEGMQVGGRRRLFIPAKNAYHNDPKHFLYNKDLVFDIELLAVYKAPVVEEPAAENADQEGVENETES